MSIAFTHAQGDLDMVLLNSAGQTVRSSAGVTNTEQFSLSGLPSSTYTLYVYGYGGAVNDYTLTAW